MVEIFEEKASKGVPFNKIATIQNATTLVRNERLQKSLSKTGNLFGNTSYYSIVGRGFLSTLPLHEDSHRPLNTPPHYIAYSPLSHIHDIMDMDLHLLSLGILVSEGPCCVFYAKTHHSTVVWHIMCFLANTLIW